MAIVSIISVRRRYLLFFGFTALLSLPSNVCSMLFARGVRLDTDERYDDDRYRDPKRYRLLSFHGHALLRPEFFFAVFENGRQLGRIVERHSKKNGSCGTSVRKRGRRAKHCI